MKKGFTLVELLGVIAILAVLAGIGIPVYTHIRNQINESVYESKRRNAEIQAERYAEKTCTAEEIAQDSCSYKVESNNIQNILITLRVTTLINDVTGIQNISKRVIVDKEPPHVVDGSVIINNDVTTTSERKVDFELSDGSGSGIAAYSVSSSNDCINATYTTTENIHQSVYLKDGIYYICAKDKMNNISNIDSSNSITVTGVDMDKPIISDFSISSLNNQYKSLSTNLNITITNKNPSSLQMCISNSGYLKDCSWVAYSSSYSWNLPGSYDGIKRVVYLSVKDDANHISNRSAEYYPYTECSAKTAKDYTSWGSCSVSCGGGIQSRTYQNYDSYTGIKCGNLITQKQSCQTQSCCSSLSTSYGSWGSCSVSCGGGTKKRTSTYRSNYNNTVCSTKVESQSCNTQSCDSTPPIVSCSTNAT